VTSAQFIYNMEDSALLTPSDSERFHKRPCWPKWLIFFIGVFIGGAIATAIILPIYMIDTNKSVLEPEMPSFGHEMRSESFYVDPNDLVLNHGSYGATLKPVIESEHRWMEEMEKNTQKWFAKVRSRARELIKSIALYVNSDPDDLVWVENASNGVNAVFRSIDFQPDDIILELSVAYPMVKNVNRFLQNRWNLTVMTAVVEIPTTKQKIIDLVQSYVDNNNIKIAIISHISSVPAIILPVEELIQICHAANTMVFIDGAHALGQIPINLRTMQPDFYVSNGHKWLCSAKGSAFLYVAKEHQNTMHPPVISNNIYEGYIKEFGFIGTRDYSAWLSVEDALNYRLKVGDREWYKYNNDLCRNATLFMSTRWNTTLPIPLDMMASMTNVQFPCNHPDPEICYTWDLNKMLAQLISNYNAWITGYEIPVLEGTQMRQRRFIRVSCQVYNELGDYISFANAFDTLASSVDTR